MRNKSQNLFLDKFNSVLLGKESEKMGETVVTTERAPKKSWFKGLKAEFNKIVWPDKESLAKQSVAVIVITFMLGVVIAILDLGIKYGLEFLI